MEEPATLGDRVLKLRRHRGLTQRELADRAGISSPFISDIENNKRNVSSSVLLRIANALGASLDYLMKGEMAETEDPSPPRVPTELAGAADEDNWSFSDTLTVLKAKKMALARRGGQGDKKIEDMTREDWKSLYDSLLDG